MSLFETIKLPKRQILDAVVERLVAQGGPAYETDRRACTYRTSCGKGCAVGVLMSDDEIEALSENGYLYGDILTALNVLEYSPSFDMRQFLVELQVVHDRFASNGMPANEWEAYITSQYARLADAWENNDDVIA